jgi:hypothetical protein
MTNAIIPSWEPVVGFEGVYEVSDQGGVRSIDRIIARYSDFHGHFQQFRRGILLTNHVDRYGYYYVHLRNAEQSLDVKLKVHKLVAQSFIGLCPEDKDQINHLDCDKQNNHVDNLEWVNASENQRHSYENGTHTLCLHRCPKTGQNTGQ